MKDVMKKCGRCKHEHLWGILSRSEDLVPLYGPRVCNEIVENAVGEKYLCNCLDFVPDGGTELMIGVDPGDVGQLWQATSFLNAQAPMATRIAVRQILSMEEGPERNKEFMGLMLSQVTDIRGALTRDESKYAHLVAHTDEIVESMRNVTQLANRLEGVKNGIEATNERIDRFEVLLNAIAEKMGVEVTQLEYPQIDDPEERPEPITESASSARRIFTQADSQMKDEAVVVDGVPADDR